MRNILRLGGALLAAGVLALGGCEQEQEAPKPGAGPQAVSWRLASAFPGGMPILGTSGRYFIEKLAAISGGRVQVEFLEPGTLMPTFEIFDAVGNGTVDAGWSSASNWLGKIPAAPLFSAVPFGPDGTEYLAWIYHGGGLELWRNIYAPHNVFPVPCGMAPPEASGWYRRPVASPERFKGMKIRFYGLGGQAMQKLGASVSLLAEGEEISKALEKGVLDGAEYSLPNIDEKLGLPAIAKHYYFPGWHQQAAILELIVNLDRWNALPASDQALIETVCRDVVLQTATEGEALQGDALENFKKQGVQFHYWNDEFLNAFRKAYDAVVRELSARDADFARAYQSLQTFRENYREWSRLSRLPEKFR
jgi:TRAP-type mannitol/chloroaromatic compound transport system substrate-binding protein